MNDLNLLKKPIFWLLLIITVVGLAISQQPDNQVHIIFCNVGQGDASLITYKQTQVLIDGGPNSKVIDCLNEHMPFWDRDIEMMVLTHPEADHDTGLSEVVSKFKVKKFVVNGIVKDNATFWKLQNEVAADNIPVYLPKAGDIFKVGDLQFTVLWPENKLGSELAWQKIAENDQSKILGSYAVNEKLNDTGIALELKYGQKKALFMADLSSEAENKLNLEDVDILKVAHHGSKYSTGTQFLELIKPELAVVSVGKNSYGHPTPETLTRLQNIGAKILRTDENGEVEFICNLTSCSLK
jgi:competence protein ComEC